MIFLLKFFIYRFRMKISLMKKSKFKEKYGSWALIAGGSQGIGEAFAIALAKRGLNLVLIARRIEPLKELASEIQSSYAVEVKCISLDLSRDDIVAKIEEELDSLAIDIVVYNAAIIPIGHYFNSNLDEQLKVLNINCRGPTYLIDHYGRQMKDRKSGAIILVSSMAGLQGTPINVHYAATKAYNIVLAEGLWFELKEHNVDVIVSITGATGTPNFFATNPDKPGFFVPKPLNPSQVAEESLNKLGKKPYVVPGFANKMATFFIKHFTRHF